MARTSANYIGPFSTNSLISMHKAGKKPVFPSADVEGGMVGGCDPTYSYIYVQYTYKV
jgi:hypothetical protein